MTLPLLTLTVFAPLIGALLLLVLPNKDGARNGLVRNVALGISLVVFVLTLAIWRAFDGSSADFQLVERVPWIVSFGIDYHVGVDGISLWLLVLTGFLTPLALLSSWHGVEHKVKEFCFFVLALETGMLGVFVSLDLFLFYIFWDAMLIPMYFLIGIWGYDQRVYAAVKFILYTMAGSVLMLIAIIGLAVIHSQATGQYSFNVLQLYQLTLDPRTQLWFFLAFALAFAIKVPLFPFHTWLPDAHVQAPTAGSVILAGVLLKMGTYGLIRFAFPLFPDAALQVAPYLGTLAVIGIVYGALVAMVQPDMKKLVAYSSVSHMGFIVLGICAANTQGLQGAIYQMLNHGVSTGGLFIIVGMLSDRRHTRQIAEYGGLKHVMPKLVAAFLIITLSSIAMPGMNGFVGEFLALMGAYRWRPELAAVAATGVILSAVYMLWMFQRVNYGPLTNPKNKHLHDLDLREWATIGPTLVLAIVMGIVPNVFLTPMAPSVERLVERLHAQRPALADAADKNPTASATAGKPAPAVATASKSQSAAAPAGKPVAAAAPATASREGVLARAVPVTTPRPVPASVSLTSEQAAR
jgi:NADH-quinone oxidoreductase subunit M